MSPCGYCKHDEAEHETIDTMDPPGRTVMVCHGHDHFCACSSFITEDDLRMEIAQEWYEEAHVG